MENCGGVDACSLLPRESALNQIDRKLILGAFWFAGPDLLLVPQAVPGSLTRGAGSVHAPLLHASDLGLLAPCSDRILRGYCNGIPAKIRLQKHCGPHGPQD